MRDWRNFKGLCLAALISLAPAAPALAAPAGNEYVPKVPKAAGEEVLRGNQGPGGTVLSPEVRGDGRGSTGSVQSSSGDATSSGDARSSGAGDVSPAGASSSPGAAETLLNPVVLLLIVGVGAAALSMTLRHRQGMSADPDADGAASAHGSTPSTPDGEIIDREPGS